MRVNAESEEWYINFEVGERPHLRGVYKITNQWLGCWN